MTICRVYFHRLGTEETSDVPVFGPDITKDPVLPNVVERFRSRWRPGTKMLLAEQVTGVVESPALWTRGVLRTARGSR